MNKIKVNEMFEGLQGEGRFTGLPVLFIRLSGCTRKCSWCDSQYHTKFKEMTVKDVSEKIKSSKKRTIVFTGGEPLLQLSSMREIITQLKRIDDKYFHLESNADLIKKTGDLHRLDKIFNYLCFSPKTKEVAENIHNLLFEPWYNLEKADCDIKVVTDLDKTGVDLLPYATMLMPLSTYDKERDLEINKKVWNYCTKNNMRFSPRLHVWVYGNKRRI